MILDRRKKPLEQTEFKFHPPDIDHFTLDNGLNVYFVERHYLPVLRLNLVVDAGSRSDPKDKNGTANLLTMTFDEGAGDLNGLQLADEFELLGSNFDTGCNHDNIFLSLRSLKENFDRSLELFSDVLLRPHLDEISFAREKRKITTRVMQLKDEADEIANQVFEYRLFGKEDPYAYPAAGSLRSIQNIICDDIRVFYRKYILPNNSSLVAIGDISKEKLIDKLNSRLGEWKSAPLEIPAQGSKPDKSFQIYVINKEDSVQTEIRAGHLTGKRGRDYMPKMILNSILGGQFSSRINLNLREKKGYTYGATSNFNYYKDRGYFVVSTSVAKENTFNAFKEILNELNLIREGVTPEELAFTRSSILRKFPSGFETNRQIAINITRMILHSLPLNHFSTYPDQVTSVTLPDVNKAAADSMEPERLLIVLVGDKKSINEQFNDSGLGKIVELNFDGELITN